jgi:hypothetical protein
MKLFGRQPVAQRAVTPPASASEPTASELAEASNCQTRVNDFFRKYSMQPLEYAELSAELADLHTQSGTARGGDRVKQLQAMVSNSISIIKAMDQKPPTPESAEARKRLLETAKKLNAELKGLTSKGAKRKRATRRKRAQRSS